MIRSKGPGTLSKRSLSTIVTWGTALSAAFIPQNRSASRLTSESVIRGRNSATHSATCSPPAPLPAPTSRTFKGSRPPRSLIVSRVESINRAKRYVSGPKNTASDCSVGKEVWTNNCCPSVEKRTVLRKNAPISSTIPASAKRCKSLWSHSLARKAQFHPSMSSKDGGPLWARAWTLAWLAGEMVVNLYARFLR